MTDKRKALIDAIQAIQQAREMYGKKPGQLPPGEFPILVDPELDEPQHNTTDDLLDQDVEIEDPDEILKKQKEEKQKRQQQKQQQAKQNKSEDEPETQEEQSGEQGKPENKNNKQNQKNEPGEEGEDSDPIPGEEGENDQDNKQGKNKENGHDPAYIKAWNEIMDRFDDESVSDDDLRQLLSAIKSDAIDSI